MTLLQQHVGDLVRVGVDHQVLDPPDIAVGGTNLFSMSYGYLARGTAS